MSFTSVEFLLFLGLVLSAYFLLPVRGQNLLLLAASYLFYGWVHQWYLILIGVTTLFDWGCALGIEKSATPRGRKAFLILSLAVNFSILGAFKYFGFFVENVTAVLTAIGLMPSPVLLQIALPAGISFFTFQSVSYAVDVYRGKVPACRSLLEYAAFASFFPQLVAGPIERADHMLPQFRALRRPALHAVRSGLVLVLWGLFQKLAIADSTGLLANKVFSIKNPSFPVLWGGVVAFGVQIYADFSGYTAIARGVARVLGIELCQNFNHPYLSQSPAEFWRRWHMSLGRWFKDYVFFPLGGSRVKGWPTARNILIVFLLSGLWHGAGWNFIAWGFFHGLLLCSWPWVARALPVFGTAGGWPGATVRIFTTFAIMHIGRLLFREQDFSMIWQHITLNPFAASVQDWRVGCSIGLEALLYGLPLTVIFPLAEHLKCLPGTDDARLQTWRWTTAQAAAASLILLGILALKSPEISSFVYFQF